MEQYKHWVVALMQEGKWGRGKEGVKLGKEHRRGDGEVAQVYHGRAGGLGRVGRWGGVGLASKEPIGQSGGGVVPGMGVKRGKGLVLPDL